MPNARERQTLLSFEIGDVVGRSVAQRVILPFEEAGIEETRDIARADGSIRDGGRWALTTSTNGSNHNRPREPLRTSSISMPRA